MGMTLHLNKLGSSSMLYVKYGGTWIGDSEEINICKDMDGHLDRQTDGQIDNKQVFCKA